MTSSQPSLPRLLLSEILALAGKELTELRRQPGVLLLVVLGPFVVLAAFGLGYRNEELALRTVFVGAADGPYEDAIDRYTAGVEQYLVPVAFTSDLFAAAEDLKAERIDLIIVLPPRPSEAIAENRRSEIAVIHNSIDPIEQIGIEFATEVAVRELNATVVTASLDALLSASAQLDDDAGQLAPLLDQLEQSVAEGDQVGAGLAAFQLSDRIADLGPSLELVSVSGGTAESSNSGQSANARAGDSAVEPEGSAAAELLITRLDRLGENPGLVNQDELAAIREDVAKIERELSLLLGLEAETLARPFTGDAESLVRAPVTAEDHVAPGATALLVQHLGVSLAALSLVRDDRRGILADLRIGPTSVVSLILGKLLALSIVAIAGATTILMGQILLLDVPMRGSVVSLMVMVVGLSVASVALGLVVASVGRTELYASQAAMITLLVALFFSGFLLDLDRVKEPFQSLGLLTPATPAVDGFRLIQLRGTGPGAEVAIVLVAQTIVSLIAAALLVRRRWKSI